MRENLEPLFHKELALERGESWSLGHESLECIHSRVTNKSTTIETGIGYSTLVFAACSGNHTVCFPVADVERKLRSYAVEFGVSFDNTKFLVGQSQFTLPKLSTELDFSLIDGDHSFPIPVIDFYYIGMLTAIGGLILVDDMTIRAVMDIYEYVSTSPHWRIIKSLDYGRALLIQKVSDFSQDWFGLQPYNYRVVRPLPAFIDRLHL